MPTKTQRAIHHDVPLSNYAVEAFASGPTQGFIAQTLFPIVPVSKETDEYYIIEPSTWLQVHSGRRSRMQAPNEVEWGVSSGNYTAKNWALRDANPLEDLANADTALDLRNTSADFVTSMLLRGYEQRVANIVTSISNCGSGVALTAGDKFSDYINSSPLAVVTTATAFLRKKTGLRPNVCAMDADTFDILSRHPELLDLFQYTQGGLVTTSDMAKVFKIPSIVIADGVYNSAVTNVDSGDVGVGANIWGNFLFLGHVTPGASMKVRSFGATMRWSPEGIQTPMQAYRYLDPDPGTKKEWTEVGVYQDEKVVAKDLGYVVTGTL